MSWDVVNGLTLLDSGANGVEQCRCPRRSGTRHMRDTLARCCGSQGRFEITCVELRTISSTRPIY